MIYTRRLREGGRQGNSEPICVYGFVGKEINDLLFLFGFNEVGTEGFLSITFSLPACPLPPSPPPCYPPPPLTHSLFLVCDLDAGWLTKNTGWKRNSPLARREVWSGEDQAPGGNLLTHAVSQAKRKSPGWGREVTGGGRELVWTKTLHLATACLPYQMALLAHC